MKKKIIDIANKISEIFIKSNPHNLYSIYIYGDGINNLDICTIENISFFIIAKDTSTKTIDLYKKLKYTLKKHPFKITFITLEELLLFQNTLLLTILSLQQNNKLIFGKDTLKSIKIDTKHLHHQCKYILINTIINLRESYIKHDNNLALLIKSSLPTIISALQHLFSPFTSLNHQDFTEQLSKKVKFNKNILNNIINEPNNKIIEKYFPSVLIELEKISSQIPEAKV
jgi:hypothetical protein